MHDSDSPQTKPAWRLYLAVGGIVLLVYCLTSWNFLLRPSPHFHFIDQAWNLMHGSSIPTRRAATRVNAPARTTLPGCRKPLIVTSLWVAGTTGRAIAS